MIDISQLTDEALVEYVRESDQEAYRELVMRYEKRLLGYARHLLSDETRASDVVQEAFIKAFVNLRGFKTNLKFSTWLYRIVHNEAMNVLVKHKREIPLPDDFDQASDEDIGAMIESNEERDRIEQCLSSLPTKYAEPLALYVFDDRSYEEISDILRLPLSTVGTRIRRAKLLMKHLCQTKNQ